MNNNLKRRRGNKKRETKLVKLNKNDDVEHSREERGDFPDTIRANFDATFYLKVSLRASKSNYS